MPLLPSTIKRESDRNTPGACMLQFARAEDILTFPEESFGVIADEIELVADAAWITVHGVQFTQEFQEEWQHEGGDQMAVASLGFVLSKDRPALLAGLYGLKPGRYVVLHHDLNKQVKVIGTKEEPAQLRVQRLEHGLGGTGGGRNAYEGLVTVSRRTACPFYQATPPDPVPNECPTVSQQLSELNAAQIAVILSNLGLTEAVQAQICQTLCAMLDAAIVLGEVDPEADITVTIDGTDYTVPFDSIENGKPSYYLFQAPTLNLYVWWEAGAWSVELTDGATYVLSTSTEDTEYPYEVTTWTPDSGDAEVSVASTGTDGDASAVTDCLSPEQAAVLLAALGGSGGSGGEVLVRNAADDETLATVTAPDSYVIPPIRIPYVDAAGVSQYFVVYVDSIASGELTVTEPGGGAPPVPRFTVRTTDTATVVGYRDLVSPTMDLPESKIRYKDEANATQELAASNTEFDGTNLRPATIIGRGTMRNSAGTGFDFVTAADLVANTVPDAPDVTYQRVDSASNPIGSPVDVPAGTAPNITCPDGTVANKASSPTYTLAIKSNSTEVLPKVRVQLRDGSTVDYDYLPTPTVIHTEQAVTNVVRTYTAGDTWNKPAGLKELLVLAIGAGGGGGSGRRGAASSQRSAGGGGGGGAMVWRRIPAASLASTETVTIGAGGTGGAAQTADSTNGNAGTLGGDTSFGSLVIADGGGSGAAGSTGGSGTGGANGGLASACTPAYGPNAWSGQQRVTPSASNGDAGANGMNGTGAAPSGGAGGGISPANAVGSGGAGGGCYNGGSLTAGPTGGASSGGAGTAGTNNVGLQLLLNTVALAVGIGTAGSGGGASIVGAAGSGGAGGNYGAGGGGGGASLNGSNSGAGGNGAGGLVVLVEIYN